MLHDRRDARVGRQRRDELTIRLHPCGAGQYNLKIASDGRVSTCICQDAAEFIVGDLRTATLDEIWSSAAIEGFRSAVAANPGVPRLPAARALQRRLAK